MRLAAVLSFLLLGSCVFFRSAAVPMPYELHPAPSGDARGLVVLLPGMGDGPEDFVAHGFVARVHELAPDFDVIAADAHLGYYTERTFLPRLHEDVLAPRAADYEQVWLVGVSLGGFGAPVYCVDHPELVDGLILLAPFMGDASIVDEVAEAGGLASWTPPPLTGTGREARYKFQQLWRFYRRYATEPESMPKLYIGRGADDDFNRANSLVASVLPPLQNRAIPGGHRWSVWRPLFDELAARAFGSD